MITARIAARLGPARGRLVGGLACCWTRCSGASLPAQIVSVGAAGAGGAVVYMRAVLAMRIPEAHQVNRLIRAQLGRA